MTRRCKPGDMATIVAEDIGCEANIGITLLVRALHRDLHGRDSWSFEDASRPVMCTGVGSTDVRRGCRTEDDGGNLVVADRFLVPWRDPDALVVDIEAREVTA